MGFPLQIAALLVAVAATFASEYPCLVSNVNLLCSNRGLTAPPAGLWLDIKLVNLDNNPITTFAKNSLTGFPNAEYFIAQRTSLVEIDLGDLVEMSKLQNVYLDYNKIRTVIPAPEGTTFEKLQFFSIYENEITTLDPDFLFNAPNLVELFIYSNPIIVKPCQPIFNHNSIQMLHFGNGSNFADMDIGALLAGVPNIIQVILTHAHLNNITGAFVNNKKLENARLDYNDITQITADTFASEGIFYKLSLLGNPLNRLDTAAVNKPMGDKGLIFIVNTPLVCNCGHEALFWWGKSRNVWVTATCGGKDVCSFNSR